MLKSDISEKAKAIGWDFLQRQFGKHFNWQQRWNEGHLLNPGELCEQHIEIHRSGCNEKCSKKTSCNFTHISGAPSD